MSMCPSQTSTKYALLSSDDLCPKASCSIIKFVIQFFWQALCYYNFVDLLRNLQKGYM